MNSIIFTKPKKITLDCIKFLHEQGENILGVIIYNSEQYRKTEFYCYCQENNIRIFNGGEIYENLNVLRGNLDAIYCNTYPKLIKSEVLDLAEKIAINFHMAPLPEYRGVFGVNFAIYNQEKQYGVTVHKISNHFDEGDIIEVDRFDIDSKNITVQELVELSEQHLLELFKRTYYSIKNNCSFDYKKQTEGKYYSRKDFEELKQIKDTDSEEVIQRKIRAFWYPPYEGAYVKLNGKKYTVLDERILKELKR